MTYLEAIEKVKEGELVKLPYFEGVFKWDYGTKKMIFNNNDFYCDADKLDILNREDFYYIT